MPTKSNQNKGENKDKEEAQLFSLEGHEVWAEVVAVYDGDTITSVFPLPMNPDGPKYKWKCRLLGVNTKEIRGTTGEEKRLAIAARDWLRAQVLDSSVKLKVGKFDKYGRVLVTVFKPLESGEFLNINQELIKEGHAEAYMV